jgi:restriction system protein
MSVPDFQSMMLPLLAFAGDGVVHSISEACDEIAKVFKVNEVDLKELLPSGSQTKFRNRVGWAKTCLLKAHLLDAPKRSHFKITQRGLDVLTEGPDRVDMKYLERFEEYREFRGIDKPKSSKRSKRESEAIATESEQTPEEVFEQSYSNLQEALIAEVLDLVKAASPGFFERLVVELLVKMGYGGSRKEAAKAVGKSGDEGIDGIIDEDRLGLDVIYIQAKRWTASPISRPEIQKFVGALQGKRAKKGVFISTANFTAGAREYVSIIEPKVVLIDGKRMAELMIEYGVGVTTTQVFSLKKVDSDYFEE